LPNLSDVMSGGNGGVPPANPTGQQTEPANSQPGSDLNSQGQAATGQQGSGTGTETKLAAWTQQLPKEYRENPEYSKALTGFEKLDDFAKSYFELTKKSDIPGEKATPEEVTAFWKKLGYPEKPDQYAVAKEENAGTFVAAAHAARLTDAQAKELWKHVSEGTARQYAAGQQAMAAQMADTDAALKKEYGDKYETTLELMKRGMGSSGVQQLLLSTGLAGNPAIVKAFIALGAAQRESGSPMSDASSSGGIKSVMEGGGFKY